MTVRFYEMLRDGEAVVGDLRIVQGKLIADPPDRIALKRLITEPFIWFDKETGERTVLIPAEDPETFLKACVLTYRGTYSWCLEIPESTGS